MIYAIPIITILVMAITGSSHQAGSNAVTMNDSIMFFGVAILIIWGYFIPSFIAFRRGAYHKLGIMLVNLFLGCTGLGYLFALIWAIYDEKGRYRG